MPIELVTRIETVRKQRHLVAASADDLARLDGVLRPGPWRTVLRGEARQRPLENWFRGLVRVVAEGVDVHPDTLHAEIKYTAGKVLHVLNSQRFGMAVVLKSTADMDDPEYSAFVRIGVEVIFRDHLPGVRRKDVYDRVLELTGERKPKMLD